ncbi:YfjI family protein [Aeromonas mytilicola]
MMNYYHSLQPVTPITPKIPLSQNVGTKPVPVFPVYVMPEELQKIIRYVQQETQASADLIATSLLGGMAQSCQDLYDVSPKAGLRIPMSLYQVVLAESGERKSTVDKMLMKPVRDLEGVLEKQYQEDKQRYNIAMRLWQSEQKALEKAFEREVGKGEAKAGSAQRLAECLGRQPIAPQRKRLLVSDATRAAVKQALGKGWPSLVLLSDEAGSILNGELLHDTPLLNSLWSAQPIEVDRATGDTYRIEDARFGAMLMVQPGLFKEYVNRQGRHARASGFFARTLLCQPTSTIGARLHGPQQVLPPPVSGKHLEWFHARVLVRLNQSFQRREEHAVRTCLTLSPEAAAKWHAEYNRIELMCGQTGSLREYRDYASKQLEHVARIAGVLEAFVTGNVVISEHTMHAAIQLASYYLDSFIHLMADDALPEEMEDEVKLKTWLQANHRRFNYLDIPKNYIRQHGPNRLRDSQRLTRTLERLQMKGKVQVYKVKRTWFVHISQNNGIVTGI